MRSRPLGSGAALRRQARLAGAIALALLLPGGPRLPPARADDARPRTITAEPKALAPEAIASLRSYVERTWTTLTRSLDDLPRAAADPKLPAPADGRWPVYVAGESSLAEVEAGLRRELEPDALSRLDLRALPAERGPGFEHGLLFLPRPYVVPGGRFNEMYGWDSYFILVGLLRSRRVALARDMVDNFLYEIESYGKVLNANRTYYLTRSQPPWVGLSCPEQADRVVAAVLPRLEARCGLLTSDTVTGAQWDAPYGWAPLQLIAIEGLRRYGHEAAARRLAIKFLGLVSKELSEHGTIVEKYDVERCDSDLGAGLRFGYSSNQVGFGWTNGVALELLADLAQPDIR